MQKNEADASAGRLAPPAKAMKAVASIMYGKIPTRRFIPTFMVAAGLVLLGAASALALGVQYPQQHVPPPAPIERRPPGSNGAMASPNQPRGGGHLAEWMNAHRNLTPQQQQQALQNEPGFRQLPPQTQERYRERLAQLNAMNPVQRERILSRNEQMERLSPDQRGEVRGAMQQLGSLPPDQRHVVARSFNELRTMPPNQRAAFMGSIPLNPAQRAALNNLMRLEPMIPR